MALATAPIAVTGLKELDQTLRTLESKMAKKVVRKGLRAGAKITLKAVQADAPKRTGTMAKAFSVIGGGRLKKGQVGVQVAVGKKWFVGDQFYAGFIEFGWNVGKRSALQLKFQSLRSRAKTKKQRAIVRQLAPPAETRRRIPGRHFAERAAERTAQAAVAAIVETIKAEIDKAVEESKKGN